VAFFDKQFFGERITDTLCDSPFDLPVDATRIDHFAGIVNRDQAFHGHLTRLAIHQHLRDLGAELKHLLAVTIRDVWHAGRILEMHQTLGV